VRTFRSLYRLERRGLLKCPIVGVAANDWSEQDLREHAREAIAGWAGEQIDEDVFNSLAKRMSYVSGEFGSGRCGDVQAGQRPRSATYAIRVVFYLEIPPFLFGPVIKGPS